MSFLFNSLLAGMLVGVGGCGYIGVQSREVGAMLFCIGLFCALGLRMPLYTGRCGYMAEKDSCGLPRLSLMLVCNLLGALLVGLAVGPMSIGVKDVVAMAESKLSQTFLSTLLRAVGCGMMMFVGVQAWKTIPGPERALGFLLAVPVFTLAGFEHCIADVFYFAAAFSKTGFISTKMVPFLLAAIVGNTLGSLLIYYGIPKEQAA